jgi:hypothetical protein
MKHYKWLTNEIHKFYVILVIAPAIGFMSNMYRSDVWLYLIPPQEVCEETLIGRYCPVEGLLSQKVTYIKMWRLDEWMGFALQ